MVSSSRIESLAARFAPYIDELRELFAGRNVPCGQPEGVRVLADRLGDPDFRDEMSSMVRSILYRESQPVPRTELMEVLAIAAGGPGIEDPAADLQEPMRRLLDFVMEVARSQRNTVPRELDEPDTDIADPVSAPAPATPVRTVILEAPPSTLPPVVSAAAEAQPASINDRLSQALSYSRENGDELNRSSVGVQPTPRAQATAAERDESLGRTFVPDRPATVQHSAFRRFYWIPGVLLLLIAIAVVWGLHSRPAARPSNEEGAPGTAQVQGQPTPNTATAPAPSQPAQNRNPDSDQTTVPAPVPGTPNRAQRSESAAEQARPAARSTATVTANRAPSRPEKPRGAQSGNLYTAGARGSREGVYLASSGVMAGHLTFAPAPPYPRLATLAHVQGEVIVQVVVDRRGEVEATRVLQGPRLLRSAAEHAVRRWRYRPYTIDGKATDVATIVTVDFRLHH